MNAIYQELSDRREQTNQWLSDHPEQPIYPFDDICDGCVYICKRHWRFHGLTGKSGKTYSVGPLCAALNRIRFVTE